jgi:glutamine synthetase
VKGLKKLLDGVVAVDLKFIDLLGTWQHLTVSPKEVNEETIKKGIGFDGSSIRTWQSIHESDMLLIPDLKTFRFDPFAAERTATVICNVFDPIAQKLYSRDPRYVAIKAIEYLKRTKIGDVAYFGPELEFFIFDSVHYTNPTDVNRAGYEIESREGPWNESSTSGHKIRHKEGYFPVPPQDSLQDIRTEMMIIMEKIGLVVEKHHHEVSTAGQTEIDLRYLPLVEMGDAVAWYKYIVKNVAARHGLTATFMPKPLFGDNGSGMHTHQSIWKNGKPLFAGKEYAGLSKIALYYIGGILKHGPALAAFCAPTVNSYKRLVPGFEAPVNLVYSSRNRSAAVRIPMYHNSPKAKRIEVRFPDPACNPYLTFAAMLMAGLDGVKNKIDPGEPKNEDIYSLDPGSLPQLPGSLEEALEALTHDNQFLKQGNVFTEDVIAAWIERKRKETKDHSLRPTPYEFYQYYDV